MPEKTARNSDNSAVGHSFVLTSTPEPVSESDKPCAYCNPDNLVDERRYNIAKERGVETSELPESAGTVMADYILRFGHKEGAGVEVPVCDMCLCDCPVEHAGQDTQSEMDYRYRGNGTVKRREITKEGGQTIHRYITEAED